MSIFYLTFLIKRNGYPILLYFLFEITIGAAILVNNVYRIPFSQRLIVDSKGLLYYLILSVFFELLIYLCNVKVEKLVSSYINQSR